MTRRQSSVVMYATQAITDRSCASFCFDWFKTHEMHVWGCSRDRIDRLLVLNTSHSIISFDKCEWKSGCLNELSGLPKRKMRCRVASRRASEFVGQSGENAWRTWRALIYYLFMHYTTYTYLANVSRVGKIDRLIPDLCSKQHLELSHLTIVIYSSWRLNYVKAVIGGNSHSLFLSHTFTQQTRAANR